MVKGTITRIEPYGAFVKLDSSSNPFNNNHHTLTGLAHISQITTLKRINCPSEIVQLDETCHAIVLEYYIDDMKRPPIAFYFLRIRAVTSMLTSRVITFLSRTVHTTCPVFKRVFLAS